MKKLEFVRMKEFGKLSDSSGAPEFNLVNWNGYEKYDLRRWGNDGEPYKGITMSSEEVEDLYSVIKEAVGISKKSIPLYTAKIGKATAKILNCFGEFGNAGNMTKQVCYIDWGYGAKYDIRPWTADYSNCGKGVTLTEDECIKLCEIIAEEFGYSDEYGISFEDFVVRRNVFRCNKNHNVETVDAKVSILDHEGEVIDEIVSAGYCKQCNCYFMLERDYVYLRRKGLLLCHLISEKYYLETGIPFYGSNLNEQSMLKAIGYNVNASEGLSSLQRQNILSFAVESGLYTISGICSFLDWLIEKNTRVANRDMSDAILKWRVDRDYISRYKMGTRPLKGVRSLKGRQVR